MQRVPFPAGRGKFSIARLLLPWSLVGMRSGLEKLHNLEALPARGFMVSCFPHKMRGASAGWTRAVAIIDE